MEKKLARLKRCAKTRYKIKLQTHPRLSVHKTSKHIYAQLIDVKLGKIIASASSVEKDVRTQIINGGNINAAKFVGKLIAERIVETGIKKVAFDRSGFKYHGRIKELADSAREFGLIF